MRGSYTRYVKLGMSVVRSMRVMFLLQPGQVLQTLIANCCTRTSDAVCIKQALSQTFVRGGGGFDFPSYRSPHHFLGYKAAFLRGHKLALS